MKRFLFITVLLIAAACTREEDIPVDTGRYVVEGWIDSGGAPVVMVSSPVTAQYASQSVASLREHIVWWADVTVSDDQGNEVALSGRWDDDYLPPFIYTTDKMRGVPGRHYTLKVRYNNREASGTTYIPQPMMLEDFTVTPANGLETDSLFAVTAHFRKPPEGTFYRFFTMVEGRDSTWCPSTLSGVTIAGNSVSILRGWSARSLWHQPLFRRGETIHVKCCTVDEAVYGFWSGFDEVVNLAPIPIFQMTDPLESNLQGAYGYWAGYGATYGKVVIDP